MEVTCETMAVLGGTLANAGVCPITSEETLNPESVRYGHSLINLIIFVKHIICPARVRMTTFSMQGCTIPDAQLWHV